MSTVEMKVCPCCGAEIPARAQACRECGADERTGWSDQTYLDGIDVGDDIDYESIKDEEFSSPKKKPQSLLRLIVVGLLLLLFLVMVVRQY